MLPPFLPFTKRPVRSTLVKRSLPPALARELLIADAPSIKGERLNLKADRLPANGRLRVLERA